MTPGPPPPAPTEQPPPAPPPAGAVPWTARDVWWGVGLLALSFVVVALALYVLRPDLDLGLLVSLGELVMVGPIIVFVFWKHRAGWGALGFRPFSWPAVQLAFGLLLVAYVVNGVYAILLGLFGLSVQADLAPIIAQLSTPWWFVLGSAVVAPLVEETFFRGFIFAGLRGRYGWGRAALISAVLFALLHGQWTAFLPIFLLGLMLAYLYQRSNSLWPGILFHVVNNGVAVAAVYLITRPGLERFVP